ncbi:hypothetical protein BDK51DRAFT_37868, partial [Blyttiomyces helicus]
MTTPPTSSESPLPSTPDELAAAAAAEAGTQRLLDDQKAELERDFAKRLEAALASKSNSNLNNGRVDFDAAVDEAIRRLQASNAKKDQDSRDVKEREAGGESVSVKQQLEWIKLGKLGNSVLPRLGTKLDECTSWFFDPSNPKSQKSLKRLLLDTFLLANLDFYLRLRLISLRHGNNDSIDAFTLKFNDLAECLPTPLSFVKGTALFINGLTFKARERIQERLDNGAYETLQAVQSAAITLQQHDGKSVAGQPVIGTADIHAYLAAMATQHHAAHAALQAQAARPSVYHPPSSLASQSHTHQREPYSSTPRKPRFPSGLCTSEDHATHLCKLYPAAQEWAAAQLNAQQRRTGVRKTGGGSVMVAVGGERGDPQGRLAMLAMNMDLGDVGFGTGTEDLGGHYGGAQFEGVTFGGAQHGDSGATSTIVSDSRALYSCSPSSSSSSVIIGDGKHLHYSGFGLLCPFTFSGLSSTSPILSRVSPPAPLPSIVTPALHVPQIAAPLMFAGSLGDAGIETHIRKHQANLIDASTGNVIGVAPREGGNYVVYTCPAPPGPVAFIAGSSDPARVASEASTSHHHGLELHDPSLFATDSAFAAIDADASIWHQRFGHMGYRSLCSLAPHVDVLPHRFKVPTEPAFCD